MSWLLTQTVSIADRHSCARSGTLVASLPSCFVVASGYSHTCKFYSAECSHFVRTSVTLEPQTGAAEITMASESQVDLQSCSSGTVRLGVEQHVFSTCIKLIPRQDNEMTAEEKYISLLLSSRPFSAYTSAMQSKPCTMHTPRKDQRMRKRPSDAPRSHMGESGRKWKGSI